MGPWLTAGLSFWIMFSVVSSFGALSAGSALSSWEKEILQKGNKWRMNYLGKFDLFSPHHDFITYKFKFIEIKQTLIVWNKDGHVLAAPDNWGTVVKFSIWYWIFWPPIATIAMQSINVFQRHSPLNARKGNYLFFNRFGVWKLLFLAVQTRVWDSSIPTPGHWVTEWLSDWV